MNDPRTGFTEEEALRAVDDGSNERRQSDGAAFHSQFEFLSQSHARPAANVPPYVQSTFDMSAMTGALPPSERSPMHAPVNFGYAEGLGGPATPSYYPMQHAQQMQGARGMPLDPTAAARIQQQYQQYGTPSQHPMMNRPQLPIQHPGQYSSYDPYGFNMNQFPPSPIDPRLAPQNPFGVSHGHGGDPTQYGRRASEPVAAVSYPRGPPRKPKQSGHALWVGNLPPAASITDLKDHFSRDATRDIQSLFLISKSNCAFVNYRSEATCVAAMNRFHDSRFHGVRLVCRLRRGAATGLSPSPSGDPTETRSSSESPARLESPAVLEASSSPTIVGTTQQSTTSTQGAKGPDETDRPRKIPEKYFVVKSLTVQDLEASVRNGIWATQSHNEDTLNQAYEEADNVYLIFSANKSGEYFGYARMASLISGDPVNLSSAFAQVESRSPGVPQSIPTPATATAPRGRVIDDSARGTIFWEAEQSDDNDEGSPDKESSEVSDSYKSGRTFPIEWMSTAKLPFYRTRGLRNPWNANREVKIARDGTEIEPSVGRRLIQMFHKPSPAQGPSHLVAPYR